MEAARGEGRSFAGQPPQGPVAPAARVARQDFVARMASLTPRRTRGMAKLGVGSAAELAVLWERLGASR